jgi:coenzyme F420-dependent glucose-6-phosphate dehydrogenase
LKISVSGSWIWMSSAAAITKRVAIASGVTAPMFKYHPAVVAQSFATLGRLYPGRIILGVGSGEAMNEAPFVESFPRWRVRFEMLIEAVQLIRKYWTSDDFFTFEGKYFKLRNAFCYDKPRVPIPIYFSAYGPKAAHFAGRHADHLVTWGLDLDFMRKTIFPSFEEGARTVGKDPRKMEKAIYLDFAFGERRKVIEHIRKSSASWLLPDNYNVPDPRRIQANASAVTEEMIEGKVFIADKASALVDFLEKYSSVPEVRHLILSDSSPSPRATLSMMGKKVIPRFKKH